MNPENDEPCTTFYSLGFGSSGGWSVDLDESSDGTVLSLQLDGPHVYVRWNIRDLAAIRAIVEYLRADCDKGEGLQLDRFGATGVCFHWDNEGKPLRCFLIVGPLAHSCVRVTLLTEDIAALVSALEEVLEDLSDEPMK